MTPQEAQTQYFAAKELLNKIARSDEATAGQREDARTARDELNLLFIGKAVASGDDLTKQYDKFVVRMSQVVNELSEESTVATSILKIQALVKQAGQLHG